MNRTSPPRSAQRVRSSAEIPDPVSDELRRYDDHLRDVRGLAAGTRRNHCRIVAQLLRKKFAGGVVTMTRLRPFDIRRFIARQLGDSPSHSAAAQVATTLRSYLRYRTICGDSVVGLNAVISSPVQWKLASLPRALKPDEVKRLLAVLPYGRKPRRGYAIVRCALDMGFRAGEIANLSIDDIDWRKGTVTLKGTKSRRQGILPLPMSTGQALADYLQHERPATASRALFLCRRESYDIPITTDVIQNVIRRACQRAGLPGSGAHVLRHTLACRLVEQGSSLKEVADVLRHRSLETTRIYAKLDTPNLAGVSEAVHLRDADVDLKRGMLTIRQTKFAKSRQLPIHPSTVKALARYRKQREQQLPTTDGMPFLISSRGNRLGLPLGERQAHRVFNSVRDSLGWINRGGHDAPRLHDLRHTFAVRRLVRWYAEGVEIDQKMLALSTYMGHAEIFYTYWYLTAVPELMAIAAGRFEQFADLAGDDDA